jgi:hypothetical protein
MLRAFTFIILICSTVGACAQDLKPNDFAAVFAKNHISKRICKEIKFENNKAIDSVMIGEAHFDAQGRMIHYTEFFARGRKMAEYNYTYDATGKMIAASVALVFNDWKPLDFILTHDAKGRVVSRELKESVANFWKKESFTYSGSILVKSEQWYEVNGGLIPNTYKDYPPTLEPRENSLTYIHDTRGLLIMHQLFNRTGRAEKALVYSYE